MTDCKTIHLSDEGICLVLDALVQARVSFELDAEKYEEFAGRERSAADRDRMLLEAADCRKKAEEYRQTWEAIREEALKGISFNAYVLLLIDKGRRAGQG